MPTPKNELFELIAPVPEIEKYEDATPMTPAQKAKFDRESRWERARIKRKASTQVKRKKKSKRKAAKKARRGKRR